MTRQQKIQEIWLATSGTTINSPEVLATLRLIDEEVVAELGEIVQNEQRAYVEYGTNFKDVSTTWAIPISAVRARIAALKGDTND